MLTFEEKKELFDGFDELTAQSVSMNRLNYHFENSAVAKTTVVKFLHPKSGNAFVYAGYLPKDETKDGYLSVIDKSAEEITDLVNKAITHLKKTEDGFEDGYEEEWKDSHNDILILRYTAPIWAIIMITESVEAVFKTKDAAESYLNDEGFSRR